MLLLWPPPPLWQINSTAGRNEDMWQFYSFTQIACEWTGHISFCICIMACRIVLKSVHIFQCPWHHVSFVFGIITRVLWIWEEIPFLHQQILPRYFPLIQISNSLSPTFPSHNPSLLPAITFAWPLSFHILFWFPSDSFTISYSVLFQSNNCSLFKYMCVFKIMSFEQWQQPRPPHPHVYSLLFPF
jgi:hypothetical protein